MKKILFLSLILMGCLTSSIYNKDGSVNCNKAPQIWWGEKGVQPTSDEIKALCSCYDWEIKSR